MRLPVALPALPAGLLARLRPVLHYFQRPDIPFSREDATRYLPWVVAVMVCLVGLLLAAGMSLHQASSHAGALNLRGFQVYVPHAIVDESLTAELTALLEAREEVRLVEALPPASLEQLIAPWTAGAIEVDDLPLPTVLEVTLHNGVDRAVAISELEALLKARVPSVDVESYQDWVDQLTRFTKTLRLGVFSLVALVLAALMALVAVVVRTSLMLHFPVVRLLHHLGARDDYIIRQFVANGCLMVLKGSAMGMGLASLLAVSVSLLSVKAASPLLPELVLSGSHLLMLIALPLMMVALTAMLVRVTIMQMLGQLN